MDSLKAVLGRSVLRKHDGPYPTDVLDVARLAVVDVTSEQELHPVDHLFDGRDGAGGSCWVASAVGPQSIVLRFHHPLVALGEVVVESEERGESCAQQVRIAGWCADSVRSFEAPALDLEYAPYKTSFHRSEWRFREHGVSHLCIRIIPVPVRRRATLTAVVLRGVSS
jgi:hypothetical protein